MRRYILGLIMAVFAFIAILPVETLAADSAISVANQEGGTASVKLTLPNGAKEEISTLSLSLVLELADEASDMGNVTCGVEFTEWVKQNAKVQTSRSSQKEVLNIYIAGTTPLFSAGDGKTLEVGEVFVKNDAGENLAFQIDLEKSELNVVRGRTTVRIGEDDLVEDPDNPDNPDGSENPPEENTSEIETVKAELKAMIERAESIPKSSRTKALQSAIDEAKRVFEDSNASLEELKAALMNLENALALYESSLNSGSNTTDTAKEKEEQNKRQNGSVTQAAKTGDTNPAVFYIVTAVLCIVLLGANRRYRHSAGENLRD